MAKVIRNRWVYRPDNKWNRYLPRRNDAVKEFDYDRNESALANYSRELADEQKPAKASKLWMAWLYRDLSSEPKWTKKHVESLFGANFKVGQMEVFRNTPLVNEELWKVKHLIELRPVVFKNGHEPTKDDVFSTKLHPNGECEVMQTGSISNENDLKLLDETKQLTPRDLQRDLTKKYHSFKSVFEQNVYTTSNITVVK
ncbi:unnamed protein product [Caenorhabditis angaria]|uniref:39S ribosomal protein L30, mitochondrial n=1 Tax=Caenorhabditis angaria TaxID=860376 RepID=A0A9P1IJS2_9PELO|nr:unnamed protein product [Caenorhabditis angaria]